MGKLKIKKREDTVRLNEEIINDLLLQSLLNCHRQPTPDNLIGLNWRNEKCQLLTLHFIREIRIWKIAST